MNKLYVVLVLLSLFSFSACSSTQELYEPYYDRANKASSDSHNQLNRD